MHHQGVGFRPESNFNGRKSAGRKVQGLSRDSAGASMCKREFDHAQLENHNRAPKTAGVVYRQSKKEGTIGQNGKEKKERRMFGLEHGDRREEGEKALHDRAGYHTRQGPTTATAIATIKAGAST
ncbi:hypothetical protein FPSE_04117 [Fusarium pseudograminearum CS3096]|uniref:Uncharacterized protein n=1 Tax=Fusarium pseudograminearum (strain CS3096) TaxID=1028729 RepID=K3W1E0_FUSPC|nr:hypothetical protein FPSE_04117 [Fusarium pseudograminearum CS3096]EKJ75735.1 hypothetical protein FPSE_04117 [Fusarium pseudograminearum CS3096]